MYKELEAKAIDTLLKYGKQNYIDSAYSYYYIYFGRVKIKRCGSVDINTVIPESAKRRVIYQNLTITEAKIITDSSFLLIRVTPLVHDSILSCNMVEGEQLPDELLFDYSKKKFIQFVYDQNSWMKVIDFNPVNDYDKRLKKIINEDNLQPHPKFKTLFMKIYN